MEESYFLIEGIKNNGEKDILNIIHFYPYERDKQLKYAVDEADEKYERVGEDFKEITIFEHIHTIK